MKERNSKTILERDLFPNEGLEKIRKMALFKI